MNGLALKHSVAMDSQKHVTNEPVHPRQEKQKRRFKLSIWGPVEQHAPLQNSVLV